MTKTESELLNEWFSSQQQYRTWNELADYIGIDKRIMSHYHTGRRRVLNPDHRALLFKATKIQAFAGEPPFEMHVRAPRSRPAPSPEHISDEETGSPLVINGVTLRNRGELSSYLKAWIVVQPKGTTMTKLARMTRIPESTFLNYFSGHGFPGPHHRAEFVSLIERLTTSEEQVVVSLSAHDQTKRLPAMPDGIESDLRDLLSKVMSKFQQLTEELHRMKVDGGEPAPRTPREHAQRVLALLYSLDRELQYFRNGSSEEREQLRRFVNGQDVGYIASLLKALYDEDKFQSWQLFANYQMVSGGNGKRGEKQ